LLQLEQPAASLDPLQHSLSIQPSLIQAHFQLAKAYRILRRSEDSRNETELFDAMTNRTDTSQELTGADQQKLWRRVKPLLETNKEQDVRNFLAVQPGEHPVGYDDYLLGIMYYSMGRSADAERVLTIAQSKAPQNARIMAYLGMVQVSLTETAAARQSFEHALVIDPGNGLALIGMGTLEYQKQDWQLAIDYLDKSRTSDSGVLFMLTDAYFRVGKTDQAMLVSQVVRAFGSDRKDLIEALNALVKLHQRDTP
jgi:tetratricopeptide (TPR) repeat protein